MSNYKKIGSIAIGVMFFLIIIKSLASTAQIIPMTMQKFGSLELVGILFFAIIILVLLWLFTMRSAIANKLFKDEGNIEVEESITFPQAVNLVCIFAGLVVLSSVIPAIFTVIHNFAPYIKINASGQKIDSGKFIWDFRQFALLVPIIIKFAIALYLVYGAPHFVRWQIKRIKKLTEKIVE